MKKNCHVLGVYFVQNANLDQYSGFPSGCKSTIDLVEFLGINPKSYRIHILHTKNRKDKRNLFSNVTNLHYSSPLFWKNEDISVGLIDHQYNFKVINSIRFSAITHSYLGYIKDQSKYYACGYPKLNHYDQLILEEYFQSKLLENFGFNPLVITAEYSHDLGKPSQEPFFIDGGIKHSSPNSEGMSGGPLMMPLEDSIEVFGVINGRNNMEFSSGTF